MTAIDPKELLRIDFSAERRKLAEAAAGPLGHLLAALVSRAVRVGASAVRIEQTPRGVSVRDDGADLAPAARAALDVLLDARRSDEERHRALVALEPEPALIGLATFPGARFERGESGTEIRLPRARLGAADERMLCEAVRFAAIPVRVGGRECPRGFEAPFAEVALAAPLAGRLALTRVDTARVLLLQGGVSFGHVSLPEAPPFEAALELGASVPVSRGAGALREAAAPRLASLVERAIALALELGSEPARRPPATRSHLRKLLLRAARGRAQRAAILRAPLLSALVGPEGRDERFLSLLDLRGAAELYWIGPDETPGEFLLPAGPVFVLDAEERARLAELFGVRFRAVPRRAAVAPLTARLRRALRSAAAASRRVAQRLRHPRAGVRVADVDLTDKERALARALGPGVRVSSGAGPARRVGGEWWLPRANPLVAACARAVSREPAWAYAAALALFEGRVAPSGEARAAWAARGRGQP